MYENRWWRGNVRLRCGVARCCVVCMVGGCSRRLIIDILIHCNRFILRWSDDWSRVVVGLIPLELQLEAGRSLCNIILSFVAANNLPADLVAYLVRSKGWIGVMLRDSVLG